MPVFAPFRTCAVVATLLIGALPSRAAAVKPAEPSPSSIVIGFVGGFVRHDNLRHNPVLLAQRLQRADSADTYVQVFENRHRKSAYQTILRLLDKNHDGVLSVDEKNHARIILFGHSWGAAAAVLLARDLRSQGIPVLLTVQVDSVAKPWQDDAVIPDNVAEAVNFHQPHGIIHGRAQIAAADPVKTQILGNYLFDYKKYPVECPAPSWFDRHVTPSHAQSECDPHLWSQVEDLVRQRLLPQLSAVAANPKP